MVPNCVPEETNEDVNVASSVFNKAKFVRSFKEMSADKAYRAMDKADKQSRGEMSVTDPKKAVKRRLQAKKFADYSIKNNGDKKQSKGKPNIIFLFWTKKNLLISYMLLFDIHSQISQDLNRVKNGKSLKV